ncbi:hypothetical protein WH52_13465 [Tenacibaculum holothuriorum]|uniref:DUF3997 domain-containing protein n=1 Tax=Tenacibaculum holothuriorum TaxID=1635173 RepID=A0A1Y2P9D9_9FLAO|nr:DUF3997 domain-containing protein [Tenacibaculum holothuriorum]OSY87064.1 hypothetical protein WH52_13465 [Tenacibaculum holothuriorum]
MKKTIKISLLLILQSCYFGVGLVEKEITNNYFLFANNKLDEMSIWFHSEEHSYQLIIPETVFAVGENGDYIIAKSHPKNKKNGIDKSITYYHIIEVRKKKANQYSNLNLEQFNKKREELNIPNSLSFKLTYKELE